MFLQYLLQNLQCHSCPWAKQNTCFFDQELLGNVLFTCVMNLLGAWLLLLMVLIFHVLTDVKLIEKYQGLWSCAADIDVFTKIAGITSCVSGWLSQSISPDIRAVCFTVAVKLTLQKSTSRWRQATFAKSALGQR